MGGRYDGGPTGGVRASGRDRAQPVYKTNLKDNLADIMRIPGVRLSIIWQTVGQTLLSIKQPKMEEVK